MSFDYWFSRRLSLRKGAPSSTATGSVIAVVGVALAIMVMELSLAVVSGFKHEIERKVMGFDAPVSILPAYDYYTASSSSEIVLTDSLRNVVDNLLDNGMRLVEENTMHGILKTDDNFLAVQCISYGPGHDYSFQQDIMEDGKLPAWPDGGTDSIVVSKSIASRLGLEISDKIYLYFFADNSPKMRRAFIGGIYSSDFGEYDDAVIYVPIDMLRGLSAHPDASTSINIEGLNKKDVEAFSDVLQQRLLEAYSAGELSSVHPVTNVLTKGAVFFNWLDLLDTNVIVIFILMICVAAFTLISSLFIIILDRVPTIGLLRALGASRRKVGNIFLFTALRLVGIGMLVGNLLALSVILIQIHTEFLPLDPAMYYLDHVPFLIGWRVVAILNVGVAAGAWLLLILPARIASRIDPALTMRYD